MICNRRFKLVEENGKLTRIVADVTRKPLRQAE
jgi:hypothetical protein